MAEGQRNASFEDSAAGWRIYKSQGGTVSREEINQSLADLGRGPISKRMYLHYRKLREAGVDEYIPINRFDLRSAVARSVISDSTRALYVDRPIETRGELHVRRPTGIVVLHGRVETVSESYASFVTEHTESASEVSSGRPPYRLGVLRFSNVEVQRAVEIRETYVETDEIEIVLAFRSLLTSELMFPQEQVSQSINTVTIPLGDNPPFAQVVESISLVFGLYESARSLSHLVGGAASLASPRIHRLTVASPLAIEILGDPNVWDLVKALMGTGTGGIGIYFGIRADRRAEHELRLKKDAAKRESDLHPLAVGSMQLENAANQLELIDKAADTASKLESLTPAELRRAEALIHNVFQAGRDLALGADGTISLDDSAESEAQPESEEDPTE